MPQKPCERHGAGHPCTCAMGNLYRFVEPVVLLLLKEKGSSYGYDLWSEAGKHALTDAELERAVFYRTLRTLESHGHVVSSWDTQGPGPARRVYRLTASGEEHLEEWTIVLRHVARSMDRFVRRFGTLRALGEATEAGKPMKNGGPAAASLRSKNGTRRTKNPVSSR